MIIYRLVNKKTGMTYIGQTMQPLKKRIQDHRTCNKAFLGRSLRKNGIEGFYIEVLDTTKSIEELNDKEEFYIDYYNCIFPNGYNHKAGGNNHRMSEDAIRRGSQTQLGRKATLETKEKQRLARLKSVKRICPNTGEIKIYDSILSTRLDGFNTKMVCKVAKNGNKNYKYSGFHWRYVDPKHEKKI